MAKVYILTEGGFNFGLGHVMRCLSLYQAIDREGIEVEFIINGDDSVSNILESYNFKVLNWLEDTTFLTKQDIVLIDSYYTTTSYLDHLNQLCLKVIHIDDVNRIVYGQDNMVLNINFFGQDVKYPQTKNIKYLTGKDYVITRDEFVGLERNEIHKDVENILITFGGKDILNLTPSIIKLINETINCNINIITTNNFDNLDQINEALTTNCLVYQNLNAIEMKDLLLKSDFLISAAGQTVNEAVRCLLPGAIIPIIDNQFGNFNFFVENNYYDDGRNLTTTKLKSLLSYENRLNKYEKIKELKVDQNGTVNVVKIINEIRKGVK